MRNRVIGTNESLYTAIIARRKMVKAIFCENQLEEKSQKRFLKDIIQMVKLIRAQGECLGIGSRRRTW